MFSWLLTPFRFIRCALFHYNRYVDIVQFQTYHGDTQIWACCQTCGRKLYQMSQ